ncbi:MAG: DUF5062 domain-containing protein [Alteromonadaceae bacterium]|nr:MAG: DUF5062 domain-containing protein [Alteromonadaceae bacterium]
MSKIKNEQELVKEAVRIGSIYAEKRAIGQVESKDSAKTKVEFIYRVLVHDKLIQPLAKGQLSDINMKHKLALWVSRQLPKDHPLLK